MDTESSQSAMLRLSVLSCHAATPAPLHACRPSPRRQFAAVLRKNVLLQTRSSRGLAGAGWAALAFEILTPAAFFLLMCLPKYYFDVKPQPIPTQLLQAVDLDQPNWANRYAGMALRNCLQFMCDLISLP